MTATKKINHAVYTTDTRSSWIRELRDILSTLGAEKVEIVGDPSELNQLKSQLIFVDGELPNLKKLLSEMDRRGKAVFLVIKENFDVGTAFSKEILELMTENIVQDVLVYPFRPIDILGKLKAYQQIMEWEEVAHLNQTFSGVLARMHEDLQLAERMQMHRRKTRFPNIKGMKINSRYLAGLKSGGDYFDVVESQAKLGPVSFVLSDSSTYGLSSIVLGVLVRVVLKLASEGPLSSSEAVQKIREEILTTLGEKDELSMFYAVLSRKELKLRYLCFGHSRIFHAPEGKEFSLLPGSSKPFSKANPEMPPVEKEIVLNPKDRLVFVSDGFIEACGGEQKIFGLINQMRELESAKLLNELAYLTKSKVPDDEMAPHDCTAVVVDLDSKQLRLA